MNRLLIIVALLFVPFFGQASTYTVTPPVIEHEVEPRDIIEDSIKITNTDSVPVKIFPSVHIITLGDDGSIKTFESPVMTDQTKTVTSWLAISRARIELAPGESIKVPLTTTVNPNAVSGDYYAFVGFGSGDKRDEAEAAVLAGQAPGVTVRISIVDKANEYLRLQEFFIDRYITNTDSVPVTYELQNIGSKPVKPSGEVVLYDVRGREVAAVAINTDGRMINPNETVTFETSIPNTKTYGRHKAFLNIEYGESLRANLYDTTFFTIVPIKMLLAIFGLLLLLTLLITLMYIMRSRKGHKDVEDDSVAMYVRSGVHSETQHHDVNLKNNN